MDREYIIYKLQQFRRIAILLTLGLISGYGISFGIDINRDKNPDIKIELAEEAVEGEIEKSDGEIDFSILPTVESIDGGKFNDEGLDLGQGEYVDISSPQNFQKAVLGKCIDLDNKYGAQCVDGFAYFHYVYTGRWLTTGGTGSAFGLWTAREQNAGDKYDLITDATQIQSGDWIVTGSGKYGHVAMAVGGFHNGYVTVLGENQGGKACEGGGAAFNIVNLSMKEFLGAFRPKIYIKEEPKKTTLEVNNETCKKVEVKAGNTLSEIMKRCRGKVDWSQMEDYAKSWKSTKIKPGQSVWDGWHSSNGVGLYAGDIIEKI